MIVTISAEAERDLEAIGDFIARDDPVRALDYVRKLRARCLSLVPMPERFSLVPRYEAHGVRRCTHGRHLIFYRIGSSDVVVLHILHAAQDYAAILFPYD